MDRAGNPAYAGQERGLLAINPTIQIKKYPASIKR